jgi:hypothetical protein
MKLIYVKGTDSVEFEVRANNPQLALDLANGIHDLLVGTGHEPKVGHLTGKIHVAAPFQDGRGAEPLIIV